MQWLRDNLHMIKAAPEVEDLAKSFDDNGGLYPAFHVARGLAALRDAPMRAVDISAPREVQAFARPGASRNRTT